jgi:hypothetical protein
MRCQNDFAWHLIMGEQQTSSSSPPIVVEWLSRKRYEQRYKDGEAPNPPHPGPSATVVAWQFAGALLITTEGSPE